jgi:tetratricopeptide (TPR) repeat protein
MTASLIALAVLGLSPKAVDLTVNASNGDVISGEKTFRVTVASTSPVTQVEFYVGNDLRDNDTSTPYEFKLDTLTEQDGNLKLTFKAFTTDGQSGKKELSLKIDNGVAKGADFHIKNGAEMLQNSKWDAAIVSGRVALMADKNSNGARMVLARAYLGKGQLDKAQQYVEDALESDPKSLQALELAAAVNLQVAFNTVNRGTDAKETLDSIRTAFKTAVETRRKSLDQQVEAFGPAKDANILAFADLAIKAQRYTLAINALQPAFNKDNRRSEIANRLAFAQLRAGRLADAAKTLNDLKKFGTPDAYSWALMAVTQTEANMDTAADEALKEGLLSDSENLGVRTAQAYIALKRNKTASLARFSQDLAREQGQRTEVNYFLSALTNRLNQYSESRKYFERSVMAEPVNYDMYIEQGNTSIGFALNRNLEAKDKTAQLEFARMMFETALVAKPDSAEALTGLSIVANLQKKVDEAVTFGEAATRASRSYAGGWYALSAAQAAKRNVTAAQEANKNAGKLDRVSLEGRNVPDANAAWRYFATGGRAAVMAPPQ